MGRERKVESRGPEYVEFGNNMAKLRKARGLSQAEIAAALGTLQSTYAGWEAGTRKVQLTTMLQLSKFFGVSIDVLIGTQKFVNVPSEKSSCELNDKEKKLVDIYRELNTAGKQKLQERADELLELGYTEKRDIEKMA
ncbi:hypothetical protein BRYFOR_05411 [Marvinbryantia formatexigens DSM 14469]|uniref:HTH cro/C1-type domain-containing protein n=1 Tax=Marvinbryantia formatexigens DSM 14469 TaxID=478749 RepID=C6L9W9_9FIRM|nr:helix-turn-helix transcriptional regulator [Marvinbryantia formatexigens]EET62376.1 hypothetical protein BRYFOR_05411 [Marvinbryantia formatexigens DSM 14469]UWO25076.1 helix-turn-helix domain-containing protein [Marvinbryantia formatexigens DSM 14469]SDG94378.1 DNA-binding transcriptional regulator, XRE-family HTH domain [Marvinbryantia formatexigens]